jgi:hypothetical protein
MVMAFEAAVEQELSPISLIESQSSSLETLATLLDDTFIKESCSEESSSSDEESTTTEPTPAPSPPPDIRLVFRMPPEQPELLRQLFLESGWEEHTPEHTYWNFWWSPRRFPACVSKGASTDHHRINHFSNTSALTKKDGLYRLLKRQRVIYGGLYSFFPAAFCLPNEYTKFVRAYASDEESGKRRIWICKPVDMSRGRGIFLVRNLQDLTYDTNLLVQAYVDKPMLVILLFNIFLDR